MTLQTTHQSSSQSFTTPQPSATVPTSATPPKNILRHLTQSWRNTESALELNHAVFFFMTFVNYVPKTASPICLDFKTVTKLSKIVCLDSEVCFESTLNGANKCLGFCETRKQVSFHVVSGVIVEHLCLLNLDFGCATVLMMGILGGISQDFSLNVSQDVSKDAWQNQTAHQSIKNLRVQRLHLRAHH